MLLQSQYGKNLLDASILGKKYEEQELSENGIDTLIRMMKSRPISKEMVDACCLDLYQHRLYFLRSTSQKNEIMYQNTVEPMLNYCINAFQKYYDFTFIDGGEIEQMPKKFLEQADVIVWNLNQNQNIIEETIDHAKEFATKSFYLIGNYEIPSKFTKQYMVRNLKIKRNQIAVIPHNVTIQDAASEGTLLKTFLLIKDSTKDEINYEFVSEVESATEKLMNFCNHLEDDLSKKEKRVLV